MQNKIKTLIFNFFLISVTVFTSLSVQLRGETKIDNRCSYLDPISVDILAFLVGLFLVFEGMYKMYNEKYAPLKKQLTRSLRVAFGCAILTLHILQFMHK